MGVMPTDRVFGDVVADHTTAFYIKSQNEPTGGRLKRIFMHLKPTFTAGYPQAASASVELGSVGALYIIRGNQLIPLGESQLFGWVSYCSFECPGDGIPLMCGDYFVARGYVETDGDEVECVAVVEPEGASK